MVGPTRTCQALGLGVLRSDPIVPLPMSKSFWIKRTLLVLAASFAVIAAGQYLRSKSWNHALTEATVWGSIATAVYLVVLWRKLRQNPACAVKADTRKG